MTKYEDLPRLTADGGAIDAQRVRWPVSYRLLHPVDETESLTLREPTVMDLEAAARQPDGIAQKVTMIANLAEVSPDTMHKLPTYDYSRLMEIVESFL